MRFFWDPKSRDFLDFSPKKIPNEKSRDFLDFRAWDFFRVGSLNPKKSETILGSGLKLLKFLKRKITKNPK